MNSSHHFEAHKNYIRGVDEATCRFMRDLLEDEDMCEFVTVTSSCHETEFKIPYLEFIFCTVNSYVDMSFFRASIILLCIQSVLVLALCSLTYIILPNIIYIIKYFHLSEHNAGATLLCIINGAPDILAAFLFYEGDTELLVNEMLGIALYLRAFHGGLLTAFFPTAFYSAYFVRDSFAYLFGIIVLYSILSERDTSIFEGIFAMVFYPTLCFVVFVQHSAAVDERKRAEHEQITPERRLELRFTEEIQIKKYQATNGKDPLKLSLWRQFIHVFNPLRSELYDNSSRWQQIILKYGIMFTIPTKILMPVVDLMLPGDGWSRLLVFLNLTLSPLLLFLCTRVEYALIATGMGIIVGTYTFFTTKTDTPKYQFQLAVHGIICQMIVATFIAGEILSIMVVLGNILGVKRPVVGVTLLALGNTIPEVVVYCTMVGWHFKMMPLANFLMAPLLNMVFAMGLTTVLKSCSDRQIEVVTRAGDLGALGIWFMIFHHVLITFAGFCTNFQVRRSIGIYSVLVYFVFLFYVCLYQFDFIHAYGTDHVDEAQFYVADWA